MDLIGNKSLLVQDSLNSLQFKRNPKESISCFVVVIVPADALASLGKKTYTVCKSSGDQFHISYFTELLLWGLNSFKDFRAMTI